MKWGMNGLGLLMVLTVISAAQAEPSGLLNDTGQTQCLNVTGTELEKCQSLNTISIPLEASPPLPVYAQIIIPLWNKEYDGTDIAKVDGCLLTGVNDGDDVSCMASAKIGPDVVISGSYHVLPQPVILDEVTLTGFDAYKYAIWSYELTNKEAIVGQAYAKVNLTNYSKVYDGTTDIWRKLLLIWRPKRRCGALLFG